MALVLLASWPAWGRGGLPDVVLGDGIAQDLCFHIAYLRQPHTVSHRQPLITARRYGRCRMFDPLPLQ